MFGYRVPDPDEALLISGGRPSSGAPFRVVIGHGAFVIPMFRRANLLSLAMTESEVQETCVTKQGIALTVSFPTRTRCPFSPAESSPVTSVPSSVR